MDSCNSLLAQTQSDLADQMVSTSWSVSTRTSISLTMVVNDSFRRSVLKQKLSKVLWCLAHNDTSWHACSGHQDLSDFVNWCICTR